MLEKFASIVKNMTTLTSSVPNCTVAIASLMYPPQLAWYPDNNIPMPANYINQIEKIHWLNYRIMVLNTDNGVPMYPRFHTYGVRKVTNTSVDRYGQQRQTVLKSHRWEHWRERDPSRMLHLRYDKRFKMGTVVQNYFLLNTLST